MKFLYAFLVSIMEKKMSHQVAQKLIATPPELVSPKSKIDYFVHGNAMCWRGEYTYGSSYCRGTSLHVFPDKGRIWRDGGDDMKMDPKELTLPLNTIKDGCCECILKFRNDDRAFRFDDKEEFQKVTCTPIEWAWFKGWKNEKDIKAYGEMYKHRFCLSTTDWYPLNGLFSRAYLFSNDETIWEKVQREMTQIFEIGDNEGVEFQWI